MVPIGYMAKRIAAKPDWLKQSKVIDIYSMSGCISEDFVDFIPFWQHNGYWLFDSPDMIRQLAQEQELDLTGTSLFYYEAHELEFDNDGRNPKIFQPESSLPTDVEVPAKKTLLGFDVVSFSMGNAAECSYLSCNGMAEFVEVNTHCLHEDFDSAVAQLKQGTFADCEPGPCRIIAVYAIT